MSNIWQILLDLAAARRAGTITSEMVRDLSAQGDTGELAAIFGPVMAPEGLVLAHLGQSLDGMIATANGASHYVTGPEDLRHKHRLRALFDASVVGAGTVFHDDPRLTVRLVDGEQPLRVVLDADRRLGVDHKLFQDGEAPTLLICGADRAPAGGKHGLAEVAGVARDNVDERQLDCRGVVDLLRNRGCGAILLEGGGVTVSRFLQAGVLDRLHLSVAPLILGAGRPALALPGVDHPDKGRRPKTRCFSLGEDVLFDCALHD